MLGRIVAWRDAQPDAGEIGLIVLSDHGHVTGRGRLSLREGLCRAGFRAGEGMSPEVDIVVAPAAAPGLWLRDPSLAHQLADFPAPQQWAGPPPARDPAILPEGRAFPLAALGSAHANSADLVATFAGDEGLDAWGLLGTAPFDAPDVPEGGMHGGLHRAEPATVLVMQGAGFRVGRLARRRRAPRGVPRGDSPGGPKALPRGAATGEPAATPGIRANFIRRRGCSRAG